MEFKKLAQLYTRFQILSYMAKPGAKDWQRAHRMHHRIVVAVLRDQGPHFREEYQMKAASRRERQALLERRRRKSSKDFLRWLRNKNALEKQATAVSLALMVWADDGGRTN